MKDWKANGASKGEERANRLAEHTRIKTQLDVLEQAEQSLAGYAEGARFLLEAARQSQLKGARGALSASLDVPAQLETAVAAALGDTLDAILLDASEIDEALQLLETNEAGRAALLPLENQARPLITKPNDEECIGVASELVNAPEEMRVAVQLVLGQTLIVRNRAAARRLIADLPTQARIVTLRGEVFRGDGLIIAGKSASAGASALSRPRQKRELTEALAEFSAQIESLNREVESLSVQIQAAQGELSQANEAVRAARLSLDHAQSNEQQAGLEFELARRQLEWQRNQQTQLKAEADETASIRQNLITSQAELENQSTAAQENVRLLSEQLRAMDLAEVQSQVSYWNTRMAVVERALADANARKAERGMDVTKFDTRRLELSTRLQEAESSLTSLEQNKSALREREAALHLQIDELSIELDPAEKDLATAEQEEARLQEAEANAQRGLASAERLFGQVQLDQVRKQEGLENLRQKITDDFGLVMFEYASDVSGPVPLPLEGMVEELPVVTETSPDLESQLTQSRTRLRRIGTDQPGSETGVRPRIRAIFVHARPSG